MISRYCNIWRKRKGRCLLAAFAGVMISAATGCGGEEWDDLLSAMNTEQDSALAMTTEDLEKGGAELYTGEGYSFYLSNDHWVNYVPDSWYAEQNKQVRFWISSYGGLKQGQVERILTAQGYRVTQRGLCKEEDGILYRVRCMETKNDVWVMNSAYPSEFEEAWGDTLWAMFDTFEVEEGYDVRAKMPKAVMPEGEHLQLYEATYADETSRAWELQEPEYIGSYIYDELTVSNVTDTTFDFIVTRRNYETEETETVLSGGTAYFNEDGISAVFEGEDYTLSFDFSDIDNPLPVVITIKLWGVEELEGISFSNNNIPGYDAG